MTIENPIRRILVANRGEIALRIMRTAKEMGIETVAVYGPGEIDAPHVRYADQAWQLNSAAPLPYLDVDAVIEVARLADADAVHPGYGFLAENARFANAVVKNGLLFVGPSASAIATMGDKIEARRVATAAGIGPVPGTTNPVTTIEEATAAAVSIGYPIAVKAVGGGGGRGFRVARTEGELPGAFEGSSGEAARYFSNPEVYLEHYLERPRHIEVQIFADNHGNVAALGERDCSVQRRHQKLIEESPSVAVDPDLRRRLGESSVTLARAVDYSGAGTIEYLLAEDGSYHFLEMNTRIQVEHTVTEMVTGIDLVKEQLLVAMGEPLSFQPADIAPIGWSFECRVNAEDAGRDFAPAPGRITTYREPVGFGVRVDSALGAGDEVMPAYDSLIAKVVTWGRNRNEARLRMIRALSDFIIQGVPTTIPFHLEVLRHPAFAEGNLSTTFLIDYPEVLPEPFPVISVTDDESQLREPLALTLEVNGKRFNTVVHGIPNQGSAIGGTQTARATRRTSGKRTEAPSGSGNELIGPIQGTVIRVSVIEGQVVEAGQVVCVVEAMKMENELQAPKAGTITFLGVEVGGTVNIGQVVARIE